MSPEWIARCRRCNWYSTCPDREMARQACIDHCTTNENHQYFETTRTYSWKVYPRS